MMFDLAALAFQAKDGRACFPMMMTREASNLTYNHIGVPDAFHPVSHHQNNAQRWPGWCASRRITARCLPGFSRVSRTRTTATRRSAITPLILYGSNMSNSNLHKPFPIADFARGRCRRSRRQPSRGCADHTPVPTSGRHARQGRNSAG
jgi:hypothetical protein